MSEITRLLDGLRSGDSDAADSLYRVVYEQLRQIARIQLARRSPATIQTTELVNEAYLKLVGSEELAPKDRVHFLSLAARAMRQILVDHFRHHAAAKRGGGERPLSIDQNDVPVAARGELLLALDRALSQMAESSPRMSNVVEWKFFGGLTDAEVAGLLNVTDRTVRNEWSKAKVWLRRTLGEAR